MKAKIAIVGSGNIGWALRKLLKDDYEIRQGDITDGFDASDISQIKDFLKDIDAVISAGPFAVNKNIAKIASEKGIGYFDLTDDVETTEYKVFGIYKYFNATMRPGSWRYKYMCSWNDETF